MFGVGKIIFFYERKLTKVTFKTHHDCIYLIRNTVKTVILWNIITILQSKWTVFYFNIFLNVIYSCHGKAKSLLAITSVFNVTWSFRNHSNTPIWCSINIFFLISDSNILRIHQKYHNLCSKDERRSYEFGTTWGWLINDRIFGLTNPLMPRLYLC